MRQELKHDQKIQSDIQPKKPKHMQEYFEIPWENQNPNHTSKKVEHCFFKKRTQSRI